MLHQKPVVKYIKMANIYCDKHTCIHGGSIPPGTCKMHAFKFFTAYKNTI